MVRLKPLLLLLIMIAELPRIAVAQIAYHWTLDGKSESYQIGLDSIVSYTGRPSICINATTESRGFISLSRWFKADLYRRKRVRLSAYLKSVDVNDWAGLWMRIEGERASEFTPVPILDSMHSRPIKGTTEWTRYELVLEVPERANRIFFGFLFSGLGTVWGDSFEFGVVDARAPITTMKSGSDGRPQHPINLDFEQFE